MSKPALLAAAIAVALFASFGVVTAVLLNPVTSTRTAIDAPSADRPGPTWTSDRADDWLREPTGSTDFTDLVARGTELVIVLPDGTTREATEALTLLR